MQIIVIHLQERYDREYWIKTHFQVNEVPTYKIWNAIKHENGELGLLETWKILTTSLLDSPHEHFLIFEDDAEFIIPNPMNEIEKVFKELPKDFDLCFLGCNLEKADTEPFSNHLIKVKTAKAAHAIIYSKEIIRKLNNALLSLQPPIPYDELLISEVQINNNSYASKPMIVGQKEGYSDIQKKIVSYNDMLKYRFNKNTNGNM